MTGSEAASWGTMFSCALMSYSFWHMFANTVRPTKVEPVVGSSASGPSEADGDAARPGRGGPGAAAAAAAAGVVVGEVQAASPAKSATAAAAAIK